jgi:hypothetical protein
VVIETKFGLGQRVYQVKNEARYIPIKCSACGGKGIVTLHNGDEWSCPKCHRRGNVSELQPPRWEVVGPYRIGNVQVSLFEKAVDKNEIRYMMYQTGVGSGTLHAEEDLFASLHDAEEEAKRRNKDG